MTHDAVQQGTDAYVHMLNKVYSARKVLWMVYTAVRALARRDPQTEQVAQQAYMTAALLHS
jgi:hypothetical protein